MKKKYSQLLATALWTLGGAVICLLIYSVFLVTSSSDELFGWLHQLFATVIAAAFAFALALVLYAFQVEERRDRLHDLLETYLDYLIDEIPIPDMEYKMEDQETKRIFVTRTVRVGYINTTIFNRILQDGDYSFIFKELVRLQGQIDFYSRITFDILTNSAIQDRNATPIEWDLIRRAAEVIRAQAQKCKDMLDEKSEGR